MDQVICQSLLYTKLHMFVSKCEMWKVSSLLIQSIEKVHRWYAVEKALWLQFDNATPTNWACDFCFVLFLIDLIVLISWISKLVVKLFLVDIHMHEMIFCFNFLGNLGNNKTWLICVIQCKSSLQCHESSNPLGNSVSQCRSSHGVSACKESRVHLFNLSDHSWLCYHLLITHWQNKSTMEVCGWLTANSCP